MSTDTNTYRAIMVCVTNQKACDGLIQRGLMRADEASVVYVVHCVPTGSHFMDTPYEGDAIEYLFTAAQLAGAQLTLLREDDVDGALVRFAQAHGVDLIIMGESTSVKNGESRDVRLQKRLPGTEFEILQ